MPERPFSVAAFRAAWADPALSLADIGRRFGIRREAARKRGLRLGLPRRTPGPCAMLSADELLQMHALGMSHAAIAEYFDCHWMTVVNSLRRLDAPSRGIGKRSTMTASEYRALRGAGQLSPSATPALFTDSVIEGQQREHSRKPDAVHAIIDERLGDHRRLELFARQPRPGWTVWGNETTKFEEAG